MLFPLNSVFEMRKTSKNKKKLIKSTSKALEKTEADEDRHSIALLKLFLDK